MIATAYWITGSLLASNVARSAVNHCMRCSRLPTWVVANFFTRPSTAAALLPASHWSSTALRCEGGNCTYWLNQ